MMMTMTMTMMVRSAAHSRCYPFHSKFFTTWALTANLRCTLSIDDIGDDIEIEIRSVIAMPELLPPFLHLNSNLRSIPKKKFSACFTFYWKASEPSLILQGQVQNKEYKGRLRGESIGKLEANAQFMRESQLGLAVI